MIKKIVLAIIVYYQKTVSPDHGCYKDNYPFGFCRFFPSCSQYAYEAIDKYGIFIGSIKAFWRFLRCNPFSKGGYDPLK